MRLSTRLIFALLLVGYSLTVDGQTFLNDEYHGQAVSLTPEAPTSDDELTFQFVLPTNEIDSSFHAEVSGQTIRLIASEADTVYTGPELVYDVIVGPLPAGVYEVELHAPPVFDPIGPSTLLGRGRLQITQGVSNTIRVPTLSGLGLAMLAFGVVLVAGFSRRV